MRFVVFSLAAAVMAFSSPASSAIVSVTGPDSSLGTAPQILVVAPGDVGDGGAINTGMQGFNERQNVLLTSDLAVDGGLILAGTRVNSQMIFLNRESITGPALIHSGVAWTFQNMILGVMSDVDGTLEALSNAFLGASGTSYPGSFANRGLEGSTDDYIFSGNVLNINLGVTQPGDWLRVVTAVPVPAALPLFGTGLALLGYAGWRRKKRRTAIAA